MEEILKQAYKKYPLGTIFKSINKREYGEIREIKPFRKDLPISWYVDRDGNSLIIRSKDGLFCNGRLCSNPEIYVDGKWAEIISLPKDYNKQINYEIY